MSRPRISSRRLFLPRHRLWFPSRVHRILGARERVPSRLWIMPPEDEESDITSSGGYAVFGEEFQTSGSLSFTKYYQERIPQGTVQILTPSAQSQTASLQFSVQPDLSMHELNSAVKFNELEHRAADIELAVSVSIEIQEEVDPLKKFLPSPPTDVCPKELQEKINRISSLKRQGKSFNANLRNRKDYRNRDFLQHTVRYQDINQIGTCFSKDVFDPHGYDKSYYYDKTSHCALPR